MEGKTRAAATIGSRPQDTADSIWPAVVKPESREDQSFPHGRILAWFRRVTAKRTASREVSTTSGVAGGGGAVGGAAGWGVGRVGGAGSSRRADDRCNHGVMNAHLLVWVQRKI